LGLSESERFIYAGLDSDAAKAKCKELCAPGIEAESDLMDAEEAMGKKAEARDKAWIPVARFLVLRRFMKPLEYDGLLAVVKDALRELLTRRLAEGEGPLTEQLVTEVFNLRWATAAHWINSTCSM